MDKLVAPLNHTVAAQRSHSLTSTFIGETRMPGNLMNNAKAVGVNEQSRREIAVTMEQAEVTGVLGGQSHSVQLTPIPTETTSGPSTAPSCRSTASWPTSAAPHFSNHTSNPQQGPSIPFPRPISLPHSLNSAIPQPLVPFSPER